MGDLRIGSHTNRILVVFNLLTFSCFFQHKLNSSNVVLDTLDALPTSEIILARFDAQESNWTLYNVFKSTPNRNFKMFLFGWINVRTNHVSFASKNGLQSMAEINNMKLREHLNGEHLRCGLFVSTQQNLLRFVTTIKSKFLYDR